jgi:hypothetical protein
MANPSGTQSRVFVIVAIGLVGLLMVGLVSIAGLVVYTRFLAPSPSPTVVAEVTGTPQPVTTPTLGVASTPIPTETAGGPALTATRVLEGGSPTATPEEEATPSPTPTGGGEMAPTGFGPLEAAAAGIGLLVVILLVRRLRVTRQA